MSRLDRRVFLAHSTFAGAFLGFTSPLRGKPPAAPLPTASSGWPRFGSDLHNSRSNRHETVIGRSNVDSLRLKWQFDAGPIQNTPAVVGDGLYFGSWDGHFYALQATTGELKWKRKIDLPPLSSGFYTLRSSPQYEDGRLYFGAGDGKLYCLAAESGRQRTPLQQQRRIVPGGSGHRGAPFSVCLFDRWKVRKAN